MKERMFLNFLADTILFWFAKKTRLGVLLDLHHQDAYHGIMGWDINDREKGIKTNGTIRRVLRLRFMRSKVSSVVDDGNAQQKS
tara:strand:- start:397 stop:648 length:252 start_codon:yes stop_codon:yes gene_type:complete